MNDCINQDKWKMYRTNVLLHFNTCLRQQIMMCIQIYAMHLIITDWRNDWITRLAWMRFFIVETETLRIADLTTHPPATDPCYTICFEMWNESCGPFRLPDVCGFDQRTIGLEPTPRFVGNRSRNTWQDVHACILDTEGQHRLHTSCFCTYWRHIGSNRVSRLTACSGELAEQQSWNRMGTNALEQHIHDTS